VRILAEEVVAGISGEEGAPGSERSTAEGGIQRVERFQDAAAELLAQLGEEA
jgi:hypothetical protein